MASKMTNNAPQRWKRRPEGSTWGDFGPDDQLGRLNLVTPQKVLQGIAEVIEGHTFCLSLPLDYPGGRALNPRREPPHLFATRRDGKPNMAFPFSRLDPHFTDVICDDAVTLALQYSTQWDSLAHMGQMFDADGDGLPEMVFCNGYRAIEHIAGPIDYRDGGERETGLESGARALGIERMAETGVQDRAVMIDLARHFGEERATVGYDSLMRIIDADRIEVESGDFVCLRTGFDRMLLGMNKTPDADTLQNRCAALDGRDPQLQRWITETGLAALIADNPAVERLPAVPGASGSFASHPLHEHYLFRLGVHLGELWYLSELADWLQDHGRSRFLLTAPPLRLPGAVGSPVTPVATV